MLRNFCGVNCEVVCSLSAKTWSWPWQASVLQDMKCLLKLTPKVWLIEPPGEWQPCKINTVHKTDWDGGGDRENKYSNYTLAIFLTLPLFAYSMMCMMLILRLHVSYVEWMRVCTTLLSTPQCWKCRPWWLSSMMTSAMQEIPWRVPRKSVRGRDSSWM